MGPDTFQASAAATPMSGGSFEANRIAMQEANKHCVGLGKEIVVTNTRNGVMNQYGDGSAEVIFRCLDPGDPDLKRLNYRKEADTVIEDRRQ